MSSPVYNARQYYVFDTFAQATNALTYINTSAWFPMQSVNAETGAIVPNADTTKWAELQQRKDGKWVFPRVPEDLMDLKAVPETDREAWFTTYAPEIEEYQNDWFEAEE